MARSKSSNRWLQEHFSDNYVKKAQASGYRSRAAFKLLEIQAKDKLIRPGMIIVDLGAAPGGWSQVAAELLHGKGKIIALDILAMDSLADVTFIQGDFEDPAILAQLMQTINQQPVDLVLSDMAPNISGIVDADQARAMGLVESALAFATQTLRPGGDYLVKVFQGEGFDIFLKQLRQHFNKVITRKPDASRARSRELYLLARGFRA